MEAKDVNMEANKEVNEADKRYHDWFCQKCGHEVLATSRPDPIRWTDGHVCYFSKVVVLEG